ncbi:hypothetical protein VNO80_03012 [Phaseolus coccineus]|uniref:Uncharacterized protein n=1 Tax=Phaseolus coccineus TaxID=3886 RepID=A0AAN9RIE6_PHACN
MHVHALNGQDSLNIPSSKSTPALSLISFESPQPTILPVPPPPPPPSSPLSPSSAAFLLHLSLLSFCFNTTCESLTPRVLNLSLILRSKRIHLLGGLIYSVN